MTQGYSIYVAPEDLDELRQFFQWKTKRAAANWQSASSDFSADSCDVDHSLKETSELIAQARHELQKAKELKLEEAQRSALVGQQRDSISTLDDRSAQAQQKIWAEEAKAQGELYAAEKNAGRGGHAYVTDDDKNVLHGVRSWIDRQRKRGALGGRKMLDKK